MSGGPRTGRARAALVAAALAAAAAPAGAQSKRYPPPTVDPDEASEHESGFWTQVADPGRARYDALVRDALLTVRGDRRRAAELLREAAAARPELIEAWAYLGLLADQVRDWRGCADGYRRAVAIDPTWRPDRTTAPGGGVGVALSGSRTLTLAHAVCRARAGDVAGAIASLQAVVARGDANPRGEPRATVELWLRLGEAYLAAGRLEDAAAALGEALSLTGGRDPDAAWLLAVAHDRARRTSAAEAAARDAQRWDPGAVIATASNRPPPIAPGDREYLLGVASLGPSAREPPDPPSPERALAYFRRYLEIAPADSPWRARAREHVDATAAVDLAARTAITGGALDRAAVERAVRARTPALRACMRAMPSTLVELRITNLGPAAGARLAPLVGGSARAPRVSRDPAVRVGDPWAAGGPPASQPPGVSAYPIISFEGTSKDALEEAAACVERVGRAIVLPRPPAGSWATVRIPAIAP